MEYFFFQVISSELSRTVSVTHVHTLSWGKIFVGVFFMTFSFALSITFRHGSVNLQKIDLGHQGLPLRQLLSRLQKTRNFHPTIIFNTQRTFFWTRCRLFMKRPIILLE